MFYHVQEYDDWDICEVHAIDYCAELKVNLSEVLLTLVERKFFLIQDLFNTSYTWGSW